MELGFMLLRKSEHFRLLLLSFSYQSSQDIFGIALPILALSLSASPFEIGLLATSRGAAYSVSSFMMGYLSDRIESRRMTLYPMTIIMVISLLFSVSTTPLELIILRFFEGLSMAMFWPTIESSIVKTEKLSISKPLREFNVSWSLGHMLGPLIGGGLITIFGVRSPFPLVGAIASANTVLIASRIARKNTDRSKTKALPFKKAVPSGVLISAAVLIGVMMTIFFTFLPVLGIQKGVSAFEIGVMLFLFGAVRMFFFHRAPASKMGLEARVLLASGSLFMIYLGEKWVVYFGVISLAASMSLIYAYTIEHILAGEKETAGLRAGIFEGSLGIGSVFGPFLAGLAATLSLSYAFVIASLSGLIFIATLRLGREFQR